MAQGPRVTLNGKGPSSPRTSKIAGAPQTFAETLAAAIANGGTVDPKLLAASHFGQGVSDQGRAALDRSGTDRIVAAIQSIRRGDANSSSVAARAQDAVNTIKAVSGLSANLAGLQSAMQRLLRPQLMLPGSSAFPAGQASNGALVPYRQAGLPAIYRSPNTGFSLSGPSSTPMSDSKEIVKYLGRIDKSTFQTQKVETDGWNGNKSLALSKAIPMPGPRAAGRTYYGYGDARDIVSRERDRPMWERKGFWQDQGFGVSDGVLRAGPGGGLRAGFGRPSLSDPGNGGGAGGAGGGRGRGGGGGGLGGLGGRAMEYGLGRAVARLPGIGAPLSTILEAGAIGGPWAAGLATLVEGADLAVFNKQYIGNALQSSAGRAAPFGDLQTAAFAIGRSQGSSGQGVLNRFYSGMFPPEVLSEFGITAADALRDIGNFGITQRSTVRLGRGGGASTDVPGAAGFDPGPFGLGVTHLDRRRFGVNNGVIHGRTSATAEATISGTTAAEADEALVRALNAPKNDAAFSDMRPEALAALKNQAAEAARYGFVTPDAAGVDKYFDRLRSVYIDASAAGLDRSAVGQSIAAAMSGGARRGGMGIDQGEVSRYIGSFTNLAGGRTGELGLSSMAALDAGADLVGRSPVQSMAYSRAAQRIDSVSKLAATFGGKVPDDMKYAVQDYMEARKHGDLPGAARLLSQMVKSHPEIETAIADAQLGDLPFHYQRTLGRMGFSPGMTLAAASNPAGAGLQHAAPNTAEQNDASKRIMTRLMSVYGYTRAAAAGVAGNIAMESRFDPLSHNSARGGHDGLINWSSDWQRRIKDHFGKRVQEMSESEQVDAIAWTNAQAGGGADAMQSPGLSSGAAGIIFNHTVERPATAGTAEMAREDANRSAAAERADAGFGTLDPNIPHAAYAATAAGSAGGARSSQDSQENFTIFYRALNQMAAAMEVTARRIQRAGGVPIAPGGANPLGPPQTP
jgi:hypothetical protein